MLKQRPPVEEVFRALGDPTRRRMVEHLVRGPASVSQLAQPLEMTLSAVVQHLAILESSGLVSSQKSGRTRTCRLEPVGLQLATDWFAGQQALWERRLDRLGEVLAADAAAAGPDLKAHPGGRGEKPTRHQPPEQERGATP